MYFWVSFHFNVIVPILRLATLLTVRIVYFLGISLCVYQGTKQQGEAGGYNLFKGTWFHLIMIALLDYIKYYGIISKSYVKVQVFFTGN